MAKDNYSSLDFSKVLKASQQDEVNALRFVNVQNVVDTYYSRAIPTYNSNNSLIDIRFYLDKTRQVASITMTGDVNGSLSGRYFLVNSGGDRIKYYVWYDDGTAVDPQVPGRVGVRVPYNQNENAPLIVYKTAVELEMTKDFFAVKFSVGPTLRLEYIDKGLSSNFTDINTGFIFNIIDLGQTELIKRYNVAQIPDIRIIYNELDKKFEFLNVGQAGGATTYEINNYIIANANVETEITIPNGTKRWMLKSREPNTKIFIRKVESGDYFTIPYGATYKEFGLTTADVVLRVSTSRDNRTIELLTWG